MACGTWFEVVARITVQAADEDDAINRVAGAVRDAKVQGIYPVADFDARPTEDPIDAARRRRKDVG